MPREPPQSEKRENEQEKDWGGKYEHGTPHPVRKRICREKS